MTISTDAPYLPSGSRHLDRRVRERLGELVDLSRKHVGPQLRAVVLGGSLARGEGVVLRKGTEEFLVSDIDLYLVVDGNSMNGSREAREALLSSSTDVSFFRAPLDLGIIHPGWFQQLGPTIPAHQLAFGHRVLYASDRDFAPEFPSVSEEGPWSIDGNDALRLLMNRFAEALLLHQHPLDDPFVLYHRWKTYLDAPLAWLASRGMYHPQRSEQRRRLEKIWQESGNRAIPWISEGLESYDAILGALLTGPIDLEIVEELPFSVVRGRGGDLSWAWPYFRDVLRSLVGQNARSAGESLALSVEAGSPSPWDVADGKDWLRRLPAVERLRTARRWARASGGPTMPWWRYGLGGMARDRVQLACALKFGALSDWSDILRDFLPEEAIVRGTHTLDPDGWLGSLWSQWVMGGAR